MPSQAVMVKSERAIDYRYRPRFETWQSLICAKDSPHKTLVTGNGFLRYAPAGRRRYNGNEEWLYEVRFVFADDEADEARQAQWDRELPIIVTERQFASSLTVESVAFQTPGGEDHKDFVRLTLRNGQPTDREVHFRVEMVWRAFDPAQRHISASSRAFLAAKDPQPCDEGVVTNDGKWLLVADTKARSTIRHNERLVMNYAVDVPAHGTRTLWFCSPLSDGRSDVFQRVDPEKELERTVQWWRDFTKSHTTIAVPDQEIVRFYHTAVNGIFQLRERKYGYLHVQPGPSIYRGFWVLDGAFLIEALETAGHFHDAAECFELLFATQKANGMFSSTVFPYETGHWKETGVGIWAIWRHYQLTGDRRWLQERYPSVRRAVEWIRRLREISRDEYPEDFEGRGLVPEGFGDGGLGMGIDYTNVFWLAGGLKAAIHIADALGEQEDADAYRREYDDYRSMVLEAMRRDFRWDDDGDSYLPTNLGTVSSATGGSSKLQGQWGFMHAVYPLEVVSAQEPMVRATIDTITRHEREETCYGVGWIPDGIWTYASGFWGNLLIKAGEYGHALDVFFSYMNHASPTRCWREEQALVGSGQSRIVGDMPHGWAYAMFVSLFRNLLAFEDGEILRLGHGADPSWIATGEGLKVEGLPTSFGRIHLRYAPKVKDELEEIHVTLKIEPKSGERNSEGEKGSDRAFLPAKIEFFFPGQPRDAVATVGGEKRRLDERGAVVIDRPGRQIELRLHVKGAKGTGATKE